MMNKNSKKNKKANKCSKPITIKEMIVMGYVLFCLGIIIYGLLLTPILNSILKHHGNKCKAIITVNESSLIHRYTSNNYLYEFSIGDKTYTGNSLIKVGNEENIGDTIEILYFKCMPFFNRPIYFWEDK